MKLNDFNKNLKQEYEENLNLKPKKDKKQKKCFTNIFNSSLCDCRIVNRNSIWVVVRTSICKEL